MLGALIEQLYVVWFHIVSNLAIQVILISTAMLFTGVGMKVWQELKKNNANALSVQTITGQRPNAELIRSMLMVFVCSVSLLVAALQGLSGIPPFTGPMSFMYLLGLFIIVAGVGVLLELKSQEQGQYPFAFLIASALAFLFLCFKFNLRDGSAMQTVGLLAVLGANGFLAARVFFPQWHAKAKVTFIVTFIAWLAVYMFA